MGKSTQASLLAQRIGAELNRDVILTREPGGTLLAEKLRELVLQGRDGLIDFRSEALIMAASRASHVSELIIPGLTRGTDVICDRFSGSYLAYQGYGRGLDLDVLKVITSFASFATEPDVTFWLDGDPGLTIRRKGADLDRIEHEPPDFFSRVAQGYAELARTNSWISLDATLSIEELHEEIFATVLRVKQNLGER